MILINYLTISVQFMNKISSISIKGQIRSRPLIPPRLSLGVPWDSSL